MSEVPSLAELVSRWHTQQRQGQSLSLAELCADCPQQIAALQQHLQAVAAMQAFLGLPTHASAGSGQPPGSALPGVPAQAATVDLPVAAQATDPRPAPTLELPAQPAVGPSPRAGTPDLPTRPPVVAALTAAVLLVLAVGATVSSYFAFEANRQAGLATQEATEKGKEVEERKRQAERADREAIEKGKEAERANQETKRESNR